MPEVSIYRLYVMRALYLLSFFGVGAMALPALTGSGPALTPMVGVAFAFWGALALLMGLGIRYPLQMLPVLLVQFTYKMIWLTTIAFPPWSAGTIDAPLADFIQGMAIGAVLDVIAIPWPYTVRHFVLKRGERWR